MQIFLLVFMVALALCMWGRKRYRKIYDAEAANLISSGITGEQIARRILEERGVAGVAVVRSRSLLADSYDPAQRRISLAPQHFGGSTYSALGIAANLAGQAIQHHEGHRPVFWRASAVKATVYLCIPLLVIGIFTVLAGMNKTLLPMVLLVWSLVAIGNLATIPTELDAGERAKKQLHKIRAFRNLDERVGVERVMGASSTMYADGFSTVFGWLHATILPWAKKQVAGE